MTPEAEVIQALFNIQNKEGHTVPFALNSAQVSYDSERTQRDLIPKPRQKGYSSYGVGLQVVKCLGVPGTRAVLMSHEASATQRLLDKAQFYLKYINGPQAELGRHSRNELYFPKTESTYYIGTAGSRAFGRGDTITDLHISEYGWWETDGLKHVAGLMQAVPKTGSIRIESTGNGRANDFYYMVSHAKKLGYNVHFRPWFADDEYSLPPPLDWAPEGHENYFQDLKSKFHLSEAQLYWYYVKLLEFRGVLRTMQQEYPSSLVECFQATGGSVYGLIEGYEDVGWTWALIEGIRTDMLQGHPREGYHYILGADPSGGTGNDEAAIQILCAETFEQVFEFGLNTIDPVDFGHYVVKVGKKYNEAFIVCEANSHGIAAHNILKKEYNRTKLYKEKVFLNKAGQIRYGFNNISETQKQRMIGASKECLEQGLKLYGKDTIDQMKLFYEDPKTGKTGGPEDGKVIALCLASVGLQKPLYLGYRKEAIAPRPEPKVVTLPKGMSMTFEEIFKRKLDPMKLYGIPRQLH